MFILLAPWLPPNTSTSGSSFFNINALLKFAFSSSVNFELFILVGVPVTTTFFAFGNLVFASSKPRSTAFAFLDKSFIATPGKALLSCKTIGIFNLLAAIPAETHIYPPVPITTSGLKSSIIFKHFF